MYHTVEQLSLRIMKDLKQKYLDYGFMLEELRVLSGKYNRSAVRLLSGDGFRGLMDWMEAKDLIKIVNNPRGKSYAVARVYYDDIIANTDLTVLGVILSWEQQQKEIYETFRTQSAEKMKEVAPSHHQADPEMTKIAEEMLEKLESQVATI